MFLFRFNLHLRCFRFPFGKEQQGRSFNRKLWGLFSLLLGLVLILESISSPAALADTFSPAVNIQNTEILWDTYGVPHIYGKNSESLFRAFGWAQMQSHGDLILRLYGQARGQAAEYWGKNYLESDRWVRSMEIPTRAHEWYQLQTADFRSYLDAFAAGMNAYALEHTDLINNEVKAVLPVKGVDILAHLQRVVNFTFVVDPKRIASIIDQQPTLNTALAQAETIGSNSWAIASSHSASGNAMLLANPHLPWSDLFLWYEAQLTAPGINAYGVALVGIPVLTIAFNDNLGWSHTVNTYDGWDAYELKLANGGYQWDNKIRPFAIKKQTLKVRQDDNTLHEENLIIPHSVHGPVIAQKDNKAIALRVAGLDEPGALEEWWDMARAKNLTEFENVLKRLQIPMFTVMYADREGHILHLFNGIVPIRAEGNFEDWLGLIPGDTSSTLWQEYLPYHDLPRVLDPQSGWLQNTNDAPWTTTFPVALDPNNYPSYIAPHGPMGLRSQRSVRMLAKDEQISFEEMVQYKHSTRMELADRVLDDLITAAQQQGGELAQRAAHVLSTWNHEANIDSHGAVLFSLWAQLANFPDMFAIPWNEKDPLNTPKGLADSANAVAALEVAASQIEAIYGSLDIPWGKVFRLCSQDLDLPANGGPDNLGIFRTLWFVPEQDGHFKAIGGDSYVAVIEFSNPVRAMVLTSYGNTTQPSGFPVNTQLEMLAHKELRPAWLSPQEVETHLGKREVF